MQNNKEDMLVKVYELGYHLIPTLAEEEVPQYVNKIKDALDSYGAIVISEEMPKRIELAYTMHPSVYRNLGNNWQLLGISGISPQTAEKQFICLLFSNTDLDR